MPSVLAIDGLRVMIYTHDHRPAHVHVIGSGAEAVFVLNCPHGPPELRESRGLQLRDVKSVIDALKPQVHLLCAEWRRIHGRH